MSNKNVFDFPCYKDALKMGTEKLKAALVPVRVRKAKKQAELEMLKLEEQIANFEASLHEMCCAEELNFSKIIDTQDDLAMVIRRKEQYQAVIDAMFPNVE